MRSVVVGCVLVLVIGASITSAEQVRRGSSASPPVIAKGEPGINWVGWAAAPSGDVFRVVADSESLAQTRVRNECESTTARTCNFIAIPTDWNVAVVNCQGRASFVGGSSIGTAEEVARNKADEAGFTSRSCLKIYTD